MTITVNNLSIGDQWRAADIKCILVGYDVEIFTSLKNVLKKLVLIIIHKRFKMLKPF